MSETNLLKIHNWPHSSDGSWWGYVTHSSCTYLLLLILSIIPSFSLIFKIGLVLMVFCLIGSHLISHFLLSGSLNQWFHLCILYSFLWCTPRFHTRPTSFHSLYYSSWLGDLKKFPLIPFVRWWHLAVHLFHSYKFCSISWNTTFTDILS